MNLGVACFAALLLALALVLRDAPAAAAASAEALGEDTYLSDDGHFPGWR